ncbi:helix-turn-helix domain-containing protein [Haladaptatus sp. DFWS20]|uniref:helix-turn-helix domain-containing protein n=1 Tax=Haladaptatus sp. DFWS20 TaxID=3403467 RepID=UPI003EB6A5C2
MREFRFTVEFDSGADPVADVFLNHPSLQAKSISLSVSTHGMWRVDRITGADDGITALTSALVDDQYCPECVGEHEKCDAQWEYEIISRDTGGVFLYSFLDTVSYCHSIPFLAATGMGNGSFFDTYRHQGIYNWRILLREHQRVSELFEQVQENVPSGVSITLQQLKEPTQWGNGAKTLADLPRNQQQAIETAHQLGYYATPRSVTLEDIATKLEIPRSTLRYRLRSAEEWVMDSFVAQHRLSE